MNEKIQKVISLYEDSYDRFTGVFIYVNCKPCDTDYASILYEDGLFYFVFSEDDIEDFKVAVDDIKDIKFDVIANTTMSIIELENGNVISIHNL